MACCVFIEVPVLGVETFVALGCLLYLLVYCTRLSIALDMHILGGC